MSDSSRLQHRSGEAAPLNFDQAVFSGIATQILQVALQRTEDQYGQDALKLSRSIPYYFKDHKVEIGAGHFVVTLNSRWTPRPDRREEMRAKLQEQTELPVKLVWNGVLSDGRVRQERPVREPDESRAPSYDKFQRMVRAGLPEGVELVKATLYNSPVGSRSFNFATVKVHCKDERKEDLRNWAEELEAQTGIGIFPDQVWVNGELKQGYRSIADADGLVRNADKVRELRERLHGIPVPRGEGCTGRPRVPENLVNLCAEPGIAIDPGGSKNIDDIIYVSEPRPDGSVTCRVSFINASWMVRTGSELYQYARRAGATVYGWQSSLPMLGQRAYDDLSLLEGQPRYVFTVQWDLAPDGTRRNRQVFNAKAMNHFQLSYDYADRIIEGHYDEASGLLTRMLEPAARLRSNRLGGGAAGTSEALRSDALIAEYMIAAYRTAAEFCTARRIPILYRVHNLPNRSQRQRLLREVRSKGITARMSRELTRPIDFCRMLDRLEDLNELKLQHELRDLYCTRSRWAANRYGHFGIGKGVGPYTTLKARKEPGLINQGQLERYLNGQTPLSSRTIGRFQGGVNRNYRKLDGKTFKLVHMDRVEHVLRQKEGGVRGTVIACNEGRTLVRLNDVPCRPALLIRSNSDTKPVSGQQLRCRVEGFCHEEDRLVLISAV